MSLRRLATLAGSAVLHAVAAGAVLALAADLRQPPALFIDLTGGAQGGEAHAMSSRAAPTGDRPPASAAAPGASARARRLLARAPGPITPPRAPIAAPEPEAQAMAEPPRPSQDAAAVDSSSRAMSVPAAGDEVEVAKAEEAATPGGAVGGGAGVTPGGAATSGVPARAGQPGGGASGAPLALAGPGPDRGDPPAEFGPYLARFRQLIQEHVVYPLAARRQGLSGRVELEVLLDPAGRVRTVSLVTSSAHGLLDEAAIEAVRRVPWLPMPEHLPRRILRVRLPVIFELH
jgi:protein TonB